jgi:hypothetical protein
MVICDHEDEKDDWQTVRKPNTRCALCGGKLHYPYVPWWRSHRTSESLFFCADCCKGGGLMRDFAEVTRITVAERLKRELATMQVGGMVAQ